MEVLWRTGPVSARGVLAALPDVDARADSTIRTTLRTLEEKAYAAHKLEGRTFLYYPLVEKAHARRNAVRHLISRFFDGSPEQLMLNVLADEHLDDVEVERLKKAIDEAPDASVPPPRGPGRTTGEDS